MLDRVPLRPGLTKEHVTDQMWKCSKLLLKCEAAHYRIYKEAIEKRAKCDVIIEANKAGSHIPSLPQVDGLEDEVQDFFNYGKKLLIEISQLIGMFFDAPDVEANLAQMRKWLSENKAGSPIENELIRMLGEDANWNWLITNLRNAMEHPKAGYRVEVENFRLLPGNKFTGPGWRYDLSAKHGAVQKEFTDIVLDFYTIAENLLTFLEQVFRLSLMCNVGPMHSSMCCKVYRIADDKIDRSCPIGYEAVLEFVESATVGGCQQDHEGMRR